MEAGAGTLTRMAKGSLDRALLVTEATPKSIEVSRRAAAILAEREIGPVLVVANRVLGEGDLERIREALPGFEVFAIPEDGAVLAADREGVSPLDRDPGSPAVRAVERLAGRL